MSAENPIVKVNYGGVLWDAKKCPSCNKLTLLKNFSKNTYSCKTCNANAIYRKPKRRGKQANA